MNRNSQSSNIQNSANDIRLRSPASIATISTEKQRGGGRRRSFAKSSSSSSTTSSSASSLAAYYASSLTSTLASFMPLLLQYSCQQKHLDKKKLNQNPKQSTADQSHTNTTLFRDFCCWQRRNIIGPLQKLLSPLESLSKVLNEAPVLIVSMWITWYWCVDPIKSMRGIFLVPICEIVNAFLKQLFQQPRPGWISGPHPVLYKQWSGEYSFPSSDMQLVACCCSFLFSDYPGSVACLIVVVAINRMYQGAHYLHDCAAGTGVGLLLTWIYVHLQVDRHIHSLLSTSRVSLVMMSLPFCLLQWLIYHKFTKNAHIPLQWDQKASTQMKAYKKIDVVEAHLKMFSGMYGLYVFLILLMPPMSEAIPPPDNATEFYARIVVGQALVVGLFLIITLLSPNHPAALMHTLRAIRYGSVPFTTFLMCPGAFSLFGAV